MSVKYSPRSAETTARMWNYIRTTYKLDIFTITGKKDLLEKVSTNEPKMAQYLSKTKYTVSLLRSQESTLKVHKTKKPYVGPTADIRKNMQGIPNKVVFIRETPKYITLFSSHKRQLKRWKKDTNKFTEEKK